MPACQAREEGNRDKTRRDHAPLQQTCRTLHLDCYYFLCAAAGRPVGRVACWHVGCAVWDAHSKLHGNPLLLLLLLLVCFVAVACNCQDGGDCVCPG